MKVCRILVSGSRTWANAGRLSSISKVEEGTAGALARSMRVTMEDTLREIVTSYEARGYTHFTLTHGGAAGADKCAGWVWGSLISKFKAAPLAGLNVTLAPVQVETAEWGERANGTYDGQAGFKRNTRMVDAGADIMIGFMVDRSSGTEDALAKAVKAQIPTFLIQTTRDQDGSYPRPHRIALSVDNIAQVFPSKRGTRSRWDMLNAPAKVEDVPLPWADEAPKVAEPVAKPAECEFTWPDGEACGLIVDHEGAHDRSLGVIQQAIDEDDIPMCALCGAEAVHGHATDCTMKDFVWVEAPVFHDRSLGQDRCGACGGTVESHRLPCFVQKRPAQRKVNA